jgi:paraquat-inducible protein B
VNAPDLNAVPTVTPQTSRRARLPLVWVIPVIAASVGGWIATRAILERGPSISVEFTDAEGIESGKTRVRYRSVDVGEVRSVTLSPNLRTAVVSIDMQKSVEPFLLHGTRFWIVRPQLGAAGVSGLGTLLSGDFIAMDVGEGPAQERHFIGLRRPPIVTGNAGGTQWILEATDLGSLGVGAPAYFHHVRVGQILSTALNADGHAVTVQVFIENPYDRFVTDETRFWHASGIDVVVDGSGVSLHSEAIATVVAGGVAFDNPADAVNAPRPTPGRRFQLAANRDAAMKPVDRNVERHVLYFQESLRGLEVGAAVDFRGVEIGNVAAKEARWDPASGEFVFPVLVDIFPDRLLGRAPDNRFQSLLPQMIRRGLRAQLRSNSLLTGRLYVALDFFPRAGQVLPQTELTPMPIPTARGNLEQLQDTLLTVADKLQRMPLDKVGRDTDAALLALTGALNHANALIVAADSGLLPEAQSAVAQARMTLARARESIAPDASLQTDLHSTLTSVGRAADSLRVLVEYLDKHPEAVLRGKSADRP